LLPDRNELIKIALMRAALELRQVEVRQHLRHIEINQEPNDQARQDLDQVAPDNALARVALLEKVAERKRVTRVRKRFAKKSTIWKLQRLVARLFRAAMALLQFGFDVAHRLQILPRKLVQIQRP
jgi:hypothetical protein